MTDHSEMCPPTNGLRCDVDTIAVVTFSFPRFRGDDAGVFVRRLVEAYQARGCRGVVVAPYDPAVSDFGTECFPVSWARYGVFRRGQLAFGEGIMPKLRRRPWLILQAPSLLVTLFWRLVRESIPYTAIHAQWLPSAIPACCAALVRRVPWIITARGEDVRLLRSKPVRLVLRPFLKRAKAIVTVSEGFATEIRDLLGTGAVPIQVIPNGVEVQVVSGDRASELLRRLGLLAEDRFILAVGSVIPRKRLETIIDALRIIRTRASKLLIVGRCDDQSYRDALQATIRDAGLGDRVLFTGALPPVDVATLQREAVICVGASEFEGRPNALLEALAQGAIVCASDIPAHREIITHGENGFLFASSAVLASQIESCMTSDMSEIRSAARQGLGSASWDLCAKRYQEVLSGVS